MGFFKLCRIVLSFRAVIYIFNKETASVSKIGIDYCLGHPF